MPKLRSQIFALAFALFAQSSLADNIVVTKQPAGDLKSCSDGVSLSWTGGTPPYVVELEDDQGVPLQRVVTDTFAGDFFWTPYIDSPPYPIQFVVTDSQSSTPGTSGLFFMDVNCATSAPASSAAPSSTTPPTTSSKPNTPFTTTSTVPPASSPNTSPASSADGPTTGTPAQQTSPSGTPTQQTSPGDSSQTPASPSATQPIASPSPSGSSPSQASPNSSGSTLGTPTTGGASTGSGSSPSGSHGTAPNKTNSNPSGTLVPTDHSSPLSPASTTGQAAHSSNTGLYAGIGVGVVVSLLLLLGGAVVWRRRRIHRAREAEELAAAATFITGGREKIIQTNEKETALTWVDDLQMHDPAAGAATPVRRGKRAMQAPSLDEQSVGAASSSAPARELPETDVPHLPAAITPDAADASTPQPNSGPAPVAVPLVTLSTNDLVRELQARMEADAMRSHTEDLPEYIEDEPRR